MQQQGPLADARRPSGAVSPGARPLALACAAVGLSLVAAGCGGAAPQDDRNAGTAGSTEVTSAAETVLTGELTESADAPDPRSTAAPQHSRGAETGPDDLWVVPTRRERVNIKVRYRSVGVGGEEVFAWFDGSQSLSSPGVTNYLIGDAAYTCSRSEAVGVCVEVPARNPNLAPRDDVYQALLARPDLAVSVTPHTVAGRSALCAVIGEAADGAAVASLPPDAVHSVCLDTGTGIVLRLSSDVGGVALEAAAVGSATQEDVSLPAAPLPMPVD